MKRINKRLMSLLLVLAMLITSLLPGIGIIAAEDPGSSPTYAVSIDPVDHGKVETDRQEYHAGETVTVSVEPDQGYRLQGLQAESQDGTGIKLQEQDGTFQFAMPEGNVKITAAMEEDQEETGEPDTEKETTGSSETQQTENPQPGPAKEPEHSNTSDGEQKKEGGAQPKQGSGETESSGEEEETTNGAELWNTPERIASLQSVQGKVARAAADDVDYVAIKNNAKGLFQGATKITDGLTMPNGYTGFMRRTSGLAPTLHFSYDSTYETGDKSYPSIILKAAYKDGRISATYPRSCYYNGTWVDIKVTATDWKKDGGSNINMFFTGERPGVMVQNCSWIELKYDFYIAGTTTPIVVKGYSTWKDIDFDQGIVLKDGFVRTKASIYAVDGAQSNLAYQTVNGNPYFFDDHNSNATDQMPGHMITALYEGSTLKAVYTFVRHTVSTTGGGAITNESDKYLPGPVSIQKRVSDNDERMVVEDTLNQSPEPRKEGFTYTVTATTAGETEDTYYMAYSIRDPFDEALNVNTAGITITDENGSNVKGWFDIGISEANVLTISAKSTMLRNASFYGKVYTINVPVTIKDFIDLRNENTYYVREKQMARIQNQAILDSDASQGEISSNQVTTWVPLVTSPKGWLNIIKTEDGTGTPLSGVTFQVYEWNGSGYNTTVYDTLSDIETKGTYKNTKPYQYTSTNQGKFKVVETQSAPDHFNPGWSQEIQYDGTAAKTLTYSVTNIKMEPKIAVTKLADRTTMEGEVKTPGWYKYEDKITYAIVAKNTGNVPVKNLTVTDTMSEDLLKAVDGASAAFDVPGTVTTVKGKTVTVTKSSPTQIVLNQLEPDDSVLLTFTVNVGGRDQVKGLQNLTNLDNVVKVTGTYHNGHQDTKVPEDADDTDNDKVNVYNPLISITKLANRTTIQPERLKEPGWYDFGETVTYSMEVKNYGNVPVHDLIVTDTLSEELTAAIYADGAGFAEEQPTETSQGKAIQITGNPDDNKTLALDKLEAGDSVVLTFEAKVRPRAELKDFPLANLENLKNHVQVTGMFDTYDGTEQVPPDADDEDSDRINIYNPLISIKKLANRTKAEDDGSRISGWYDFEETVIYTMTVRNYGNTPVKNLTVTDKLSEELGAAVYADEAGFADGQATSTQNGKPIRISKNPENNKEVVLNNLEPGDSVELIFEAKVRPREELKDFPLEHLENLENQVKIVGEYDNSDADPEPAKVPEDEDDQDNDEVNVYNPLISVTKLADRTTVQEDTTKVQGWYDFEETITYAMEVKNYGNVAVHDLIVTDTLSEELAAAVYADEAGFLLETEETGTEESEPEGETEAPEENLQESITVTAVTENGKTVQITMSQENNKEVVLDNLEPGDGVELTFTAKVRPRAELKDFPLEKLENLNNHVQVVGEYDNSDADPNPAKVPEDEDDQDNDEVNVYNPLISITKLADRTKTAEDGSRTSGWYDFEEIITYTMEIKNYGNVTVKDLTVEDVLSDKLAAAVYSDQAGFVLVSNPDEEDPWDGEFVVSTTKNGKPIRIDKDPDNNKRVTLSELGRGDSMELTFTAKVRPRDDLKDFKLENLENIDNHVRVKGFYDNSDEDPNPAKVPEDEDDQDHDQVNVYNPLISITKQADRTTVKDDGNREGGWYNFGETIIYTMTVENYGNTPVNNLVVTDTLSEELEAVIYAKDAGFVLEIQEEAPDDTQESEPESESETESESESESEVESESEPESEPGSETEIESQNEYAIFTTKNGKPILVTRDLQNNKKVYLDSLAPGDSVELTFQATVKIREELKDFDLDKLEQLENNVKVTGEYDNSDPDPDPAPVPEDEDDQDRDQVNVYNPLISVTKLSDRTEVTGEGMKMPGEYDFEETVTYFIQVRNYGNVLATDLVLEDTLSEELKKTIDVTTASCVEGTLKTEQKKEVKAVKESNTKLLLDRLEAGDSVTVTFQAKVKCREELKDFTSVELKKLNNRVSVTGKYDNGKDIPKDEDDDDNETIDVRNPKLSVIKVADRTTGITVNDGTYTGDKKPGMYDFGGKVSYNITIKNTGTVELFDVRATDSMSEKLLKIIESGMFEIGDSAKTSMGNTVSLKGDGKEEAVIEKLLPGESVTLKFVVTLQENGIKNLEDIKNAVTVTGSYDPDDPKGVPKDEDDEDQDVFNLSYGYVEIRKTAQENGKVLPGAEFEIHRKGGTLVDTVTTNSKGIAKSRELGLGEYYLLETKAPEGYKLNVSKIPFEITKHGQTVQKQVENEKDGTISDSSSVSNTSKSTSTVSKNGNPPKTEDTTDIVFYIIILCIAAAAFLIGWRKHKRK